MVAKSTWHCKCGFRGKDMKRVAKHMAKGQGHYRVGLVEWARDQVERLERQRVKGVRAIART